MSARDRFRRIESIFRVASALPPEARRAFVESACRERPSMCIEVLGMLDADARRTGAIDVAAVDGRIRLTDLVDGATDVPSMPVRIGRYRIVGLLGEGGMGIVYEAEQEQPRRRVALKIMRVATASRAMIQRFRREAEALGRLQHPGIAQVFEAGVDDWGAGAQPFVAMELIDGEPLMSHVARRGLGVDERLALVARLCDAVHHAHQKGVIHRDLKPGNVMVVDEPTEAEPGTSSRGSSGGSSLGLSGAQPKILDFGVARVLEPSGETATLATHVGQIIGTVAYMSPEQAGGEVAEIDTRSDIYALGVIAYELLSGQLPHAVDGVPLAVALERIRAAPPRPLGRLDRRFRGDIETIVGKALQLDPDRRYASAAEMASDLRATLRGETIRARKVGPTELLWRFAQRNRYVVIAASLAVACLVLATAYSMRQASLAQSAAAAATLESYRSTVGAAAAAVRFHEVAEAKRQLDAAPAALRGWEWDHLHSRLNDSLLTFAGGVATGTFVAFSPDGSRLATANQQGEVRTFQVSGDPRAAAGSTPPMPSAVHQIDGSFRDRWTLALAFTPDGERILVGGRSVVLECATHDLRPMERWASGANAIAIDPSRRTVVLWEEGSREVAMASIDRQETTFATTVPDRPQAVAVSPDGSLVAIAVARPPTLIVQSTSEGVGPMVRNDLPSLNDLDFSPDGRRLAAAGSDGLVRIFAIGDGSTGEKLVATVAMAGHVASVTVCAFDPSGEILASASSDATVRLWCARTGDALAVMHGAAFVPTDIAFSPDGTTIAVAGHDGTVQVYPTQRRGDPFVVSAPHSVYGVAFGTDGASEEWLWIASLGGESPLRSWDLRRWRETAALGSGNASSIAVDREGERIAVGRSSGPTSIFDRAGNEIATVGGHGWRTDWVAFGDGGATLLSAGNDGRVNLFDIASGARLATGGFVRASDALVLRPVQSPDRRTLYVGAGEQLVVVDARTLEERTRLAGSPAPIRALAISADGRTLAGGATDGSITLWDLSTNQPTVTMGGGSEAIFALAFSPDGARLASGGADRIVRIWDPRLGIDLVRLGRHRSFVYCLAWSADGRTLVSGGGDATVRVWATRPWRSVLAEQSNP